MMSDDRRRSVCLSSCHPHSAGNVCADVSGAVQAERHWIHVYAVFGPSLRSVAAVAVRPVGMVQDRDNQMQGAASALEYG